MTTSSASSPVTRETTAYVRDKGLRPVVVTIEHGMLSLRLKGLRSRETVDIASIYQRAVKDRVWTEKMAKAKARAERKAKRKKHRSLDAAGKRFAREHMKEVAKKES